MGKGGGGGEGGRGGGGGQGGGRGGGGYPAVTLAGRILLAGPLTLSYVVTPNGCLYSSDSITAISCYNQPVIDGYPAS